MRTQFPTRIAKTVMFAVCAAAAASCGGGGGASTAPTGNNSGTTSQAIAAVSISGSTSTVQVGSTVALTGVAVNSGGSIVSATFSWSSSNTGAATVGSSTGVVTGVAVGTSTITASASGFSATRVMTVTAAGSGGGPPPLQATINTPGTSFNPDAVTIGVGGTVTWVFSGTTHNVNFAGGAGTPQAIPNTTNGSVARTFTTAGSFTMNCTLHAGMTGVVTVQ